MASATFLSTLVFSAMASMIYDFVNAIIFSSLSIPCQGRTTRIPHHYKKCFPEGKKNRIADETWNQAPKPPSATRTSLITCCNQHWQRKNSQKKGRPAKDSPGGPVAG
jgi:hypothetical protein